MTETYIDCWSDEDKAGLAAMSYAAESDEREEDEEEIERLCRDWEASGRDITEYLDAGDSVEWEDADYRGSGPNNRKVVVDLTRTYMREIGVAPLLTHEEEIELAKRVEAGDKEAFDRLVVSNLRLVVSVAKRYVNRGVPFLDLIEEGNLGLMKAVRKYNYRKGFRFSTYATHWIRQTVSRAIDDKSEVIRKPVHVAGKITKYRQAVAVLQQTNGCLPDEGEIARWMGISEGKVRALQKGFCRTVSLSTPTGEDEDSELIEFISDDGAILPEDKVDKVILRETMSDLLGRLTPRERTVICRRYGLGEKDAETLESIGKDMGVTRERVRQIEMKALRRLRHPAFARQLEPFLKR